MDVAERHRGRAGAAARHIAAERLRLAGAGVDLAATGDVRAGIERVAGAEVGVVIVDRDLDIVGAEVQARAVVDQIVAV